MEAGREVAFVHVELVSKFLDDLQVELELLAGFQGVALEL